MIRLAALTFLALSISCLSGADDPPEKKRTTPQEAKHKKAEPAKQETKSEPAHPAAQRQPEPERSRAEPARPTTNAPVEPNRQPNTAPAGAPRVAPTGPNSNRPNNPNFSNSPNNNGGRTPLTPFRGSGRVEAGRNGVQFQRDPRGNVRAIQRGDLAVNRGPAGFVRSERIRPDGSRLVAYRNGGYVQRSFTYSSRTVTVRNYYVGGVRYTSYYTPYTYRGVVVNVYAPPVYYSPGFYGYVYNPWARPVVYSWGWSGSPWVGYYRGYFTPYPSYAAPAFWLTDYLIAQSLQQSYQQQMAYQQQQQQQGYYSAPPAPLTPEVKQQIADEVRRQIVLENAERQTPAGSMPDPASSGIVRDLNDGTPHVFVAADPITVTGATGECALTEGDVIQLSGPPAPDATYASAIVLSSKGGQDCAKSSTVNVNFADLQDMQNHMRETIDQGMAEMQKNQGNAGLPPIPAAANAPPAQAPFAAAAPPPDPNDAAELARQNQDATQAEQDALASALGGPSANSPAPYPGTDPAPSPNQQPATVSVGQTVDEVEAIMGKPKEIARTPGKIIYVYSGFRVIFINGKVNDIQ